MPEETVERRGAKWLLTVLLVVAIFGFLFIAGYTMNLHKRNTPFFESQTPNNTHSTR